MTFIILINTVYIEYVQSIIFLIYLAIIMVEFIIDFVITMIIIIIVTVAAKSIIFLLLRRYCF